MDMETSEFIGRNQTGLARGRALSSTRDASTWNLKHHQRNELCLGLPWFGCDVRSLFIAS